MRSYDKAGRLTAETDYDAQPWSQDFSQDAAGLRGSGLEDPNYMRVENGRLVLQTQDAGRAGLGGWRLQRGGHPRRRR